MFQISPPKTPHPRRPIARARKDTTEMCSHNREKTNQPTFFATMLPIFAGSANTLLVYFCPAERPATLAPRARQEPRKNSAHYAPLLRIWCAPQHAPTKTVTRAIGRRPCARVTVRKHAYCPFCELVAARRPSKEACAGAAGMDFPLPNRAQTSTSPTYFLRPIVCRPRPRRPTTGSKVGMRTRAAGRAIKTSSISLRSCALLIVPILPCQMDAQNHPQAHISRGLAPHPPPERDRSEGKVGPQGSARRGRGSSTR